MFSHASFQANERFSTILIFVDADSSGEYAQCAAKQTYSISKSLSWI
jgi:hypothetical protein